MPTIGNREVGLHTVDRDETVYAGPTNTVSHVDIVSLRRTLPDQKKKVLRTNVRFERGFPNTDPAGPEINVPVSIVVTMPQSGVNVANVKAFIADTLTQAATVASELAVTGDIHLT